MAYSVGDYANVLRVARARGEATAPPIVPVAQDAAARAAAVKAFKEEEAAAAAAAASVPAAVAEPKKPLFTGTLGPEMSEQIDPYMADKQRLVASILREADSKSPDQPKTNFSQFYTPEFVKEQVNQLRGDQTFAGLLSMSGDKALSPFGRDLMRQSDPNQFMQEAASEERGRQYQQWQADYTARRDPDERINRLTKALGAMPDAPGEGEDAQNIFAGVVKDLPKNAEFLRYTGELNRTWNPKFQQLISKKQGLFALLGSDRAAQVASRQGLEQEFADLIGKDGITEKDVRDAALWFSKFARVYSAPLRHEYFGSALTAQEDRRFQELLGFNENTDPETVRRQLNAMYGEALSGARTRAKGYSATFGRKKVLPYYENEDGTSLLDDIVGFGGGNNDGGVGGDDYEEMKARLLGP